MIALPSLFGSDRDGAPNEDRLLDLYWNRAQLKKEYAALRKDRFQLLDALTEQEGVAARLRQKLEYLEDLLGDPETADSTVVFYSLRRLWRHCGRRLKAFSADLVEKYETRESRNRQARWSSEIDAEKTALDHKIMTDTTQIRDLLMRADAIETRLLKLTGFWNYFRRRSLEKRKAGIEQESMCIQKAVTELRERRAELDSAEPPVLDGLSVETRRAVNFTVIALAEYLYKHYSVHGIVNLVQSTREKSAGSTHYGTTDECLRIHADIDDLSTQLNSVVGTQEFVLGLKQRAMQLRSVAKFKKANHAIPMPGSLNSDEPNVLADDCWSVSQALIH